MKLIKELMEAKRSFDDETLEFLVDKMEELINTDAAEDIEDAAYGVVEIETQDNPLSDDNEELLVRKLITLYKKLK